MAFLWGLRNDEKQGTERTLMMRVACQAHNGATALHNAAGGGHETVVDALLSAKADTDIQNSNCNTPLHLAAAKGNLLGRGVL